MTRLNDEPARREGGTAEPRRTELLCLDKNERSEPPPPWVTSILADVSPDLVWKYPDRRPLEIKLARKFGLAEDQVWVTAGSDQAIRGFFSQLPPETNVILPQPIFVVFPTVARELGLTCVDLPAQADLSVDVDCIHRTLDTVRRAVLVLTRPNNPTGELLPRARVEELVAACARQGGLVLLDEAYVEFSGDTLVDLLADHDNLLILRTFSKAFGLAGMRVGCLLGPAKWVRATKQKALPYEVTSVSLFMAERALESDAEEDVTRYGQRVARNRDELAESLRAQNVEVFDSAANFLLLRMTARRAEFVAGVLGDGGIRARRFDRPELKGCLRFSVPERVDALTAALARAISPQLICLDVDGTLIDTRPSFDEVIRLLVAQWTGRSISVQDIEEKRMQGGFNDDYVLAHALISDFGVSAALDQIVAQGTALYLGSEERPGLCQREEALIRPEVWRRVRRKCPVALVTGRSRDELGSARALLEIDDDVLVVSVDDVRQKKPHPEGILRAARHFAADRVWMVGDNADDMAAARAAGSVGIAVGGNAHRLLDRGAVTALETINQIEEYL